MNKLLVIGTSHTFGDCWDVYRLPLEQRWHTIVGKEMNCEVTTLAIAGATSEQQMHTVFRYFKQYPDARFDYVIVEGRHLGNHDVSYPRPLSGGKQDIADFDSEDKHDIFLESWNSDLDEEAKGDWKKIRFLPFSSWAVNQKDMLDFKEWHKEYVYSPLHFIHNATANLAMCKYLEDYCDNVYWFSLGVTKVAKHWNNYLYDFIKDYTHEDTWPGIEYKSPQCKCGHPNADGHKEVAQQVLSALRKKYD